MPKGNNDAVYRWYADTNGVLERLYTGWSALRYPVEDEANIRAILNSFKSFIAFLRQSEMSVGAAQEASLRNNEKVFSERIAFAQAERQKAIEHALMMDNAVDAYGFKVCSGVIDLI